MKCLIYSDLHLEFGYPAQLKDSKHLNEVDVVILAGDIITFNNIEPLKRFLDEVTTPVLFVAGNHEYYTNNAMDSMEQDFASYITKEIPILSWLRDNESTLFLDTHKVSIFGGTMWTDFNKANPLSMWNAEKNMNDFKVIRTKQLHRITANILVDLHEQFKVELLAYLNKYKDSPDVKKLVITHHAPVINSNSAYNASKLRDAYNSLDMIELIHEYQPDLWVYGHTHEQDDQRMGKTRIVSNPLGYYQHQVNKDFESDGLLIEI